MANDGTENVKKHWLTSSWAQKWSNENPMSYVMVGVSIWSFFTCVNLALVLGWNIWVDDLFENFYGPEDTTPFTFARGQPVFALSLFMLLAGFSQGVLAFCGWSYEDTVIFRIGSFKFHGGIRRLYIIGTIGILLGTIGIGLACHYVLFWLLWLSCVVFGLALGLTQPVQRYTPMALYTAVGKRGSGSGLSSSWGGTRKVLLIKSFRKPIKCMSIL